MHCLSPYISKLYIQDTTLQVNNAPKIDQKTNKQIHKQKQLNIKHICIKNNKNRKMKKIEQ